MSNNVSSATDHPATPAGSTVGERFFAYITKYALTMGIEAIWAESCENVRGEFKGMIRKITDRGSYPENFHGEGREWHRTMEGAVAWAEVMRKAKIESLKKKIAKLERLNFTTGGTHD